MTGHRNKHAWLWVAIAAISLASVSRAEAGSDSARAYANPVFQFLVRSHNASAARSGAARFAPRRSIGRIRAIFRDAGSPTWIACLPVLLFGFIAPLSLFSGVSVRSPQCAPAAPLLPGSFQRPPPVLA